jgi:putative serine protease PepD
MSDMFPNDSDDHQNQDGRSTGDGMYPPTGPARPESSGPSSPFGPPPGTSPYGQQPATPQPSTPPTAPPPGQPVATVTRRGPGWFGVIVLVLVGMVISSGLTFAAVRGGQQPGDGPTAGAASPSHGDDDSGGSTSSDSGKSSDDKTSRTVANRAGSDDWQTVAKKISPSTVAIAVSTHDGQAEGTGVVYDDKGTIVTNNHVVSKADTVQVSLSDGRSYSADVVGTDKSTDLAVIRLQNPPDDLKAADLGDSDDVTVGEGTMAVGTPLGLQNTVTTGIISAIHRPVTTMGESEDGSDAAFTSALQTDAPINPGNSGGPLVDADGTVIGINSSIASFANSTEQQSGSIGLGFAIPSNTVQLIVPQLIENGSAKHALLGVTASDGSAKVDSVTYFGAEVREVTGGSSARKAGLRKGDLVTAIDDVRVNGSAGLTGLVRSLEVGSKHSVTVVRDGTEQDVDVTFSQSD